jgi:RNA polymerase sigma-70 factor, ECF subfamily
MAELAGTRLTPDAFERYLVENRARLHRYCARMTGSVIDGEDVLQDAMLKAFRALQSGDSVDQPDRWMFRIAHNAALDFLRRRARVDAKLAAEDPDMLEEPNDPFDRSEVVATSLRTFMRLPSAQRSTVILKDVLGYSLDDIGGIIDASLPAVKSALNRGRTRLRSLAFEPEDAAPPELSNAERTRLSVYIEHFNAREFDAIREMLADDVHLDLVARRELHGRKQVQTYFHNYSSAEDWRMRLGFVDRRPAILAHDPRKSEQPVCFILLEWAGADLSHIRDFRYAPYAIEGAEISIEG